MSTMLKNFCVEPTLEGCICATDPRCGGIVDADPRCPEHGLNVTRDDLIESHFHAVPGLMVGT